MERHFRLQAVVLDTLKSNSLAWERFQRRNHHRRRQSHVQQLEIQMRQSALMKSSDQGQHG